ncbi:hypothetical protein [Kocuria atrinae]|uniref:hypothetical protein n=1 Tax=Kocuria atrinae TaxID=592377 RepID=UPI001CB92858|nr:hypothetical protein [Kocuria atrinae]
MWVNPDCGLKTRGWPETEAASIASWPPPSPCALSSPTTTPRPHPPLPPLKPWPAHPKGASCDRADQTRTPG